MKPFILLLKIQLLGPVSYTHLVDGMPLDVLPSNALASSKKGR